MKNFPSKSIASNKEKLPGPRNASTTFAIVIISIILFSIPWMIYQFIPEVSTVPGIGASKCLYPYTNQIFIAVAIVLSVINILITVVRGFLTKSSYHWKEFTIFETALLLGIAIAIVLNTAACNFEPAPL